MNAGYRVPCLSQLPLVNSELAADVLASVGGADAPVPGGDIRREDKTIGPWTFDAVVRHALIHWDDAGSRAIGIRLQKEARPGPFPVPPGIQIEEATPKVGGGECG